MNADLARLLAEATRQVHPTRCLDLGCGDGATCFWLADRGCDVLGVDLALPLPPHTRVFVRDVGPGSVVLMSADVLTLEIEEPFDVVLAIGLLHNLGSWESVARVLSRLSAWTAVGGRALVSWLVDVTPVTPTHVDAYFPPAAMVADALTRRGFARAALWETEIEHAHAGPSHRHRVVYSSWAHTLGAALLSPSGNTPSGLDKG